MVLGSRQLHITLCFHCVNVSCLARLKLFIRYVYPTVLHEFHVKDCMEVSSEFPSAWSRREEERHLALVMAGEVEEKS